MSPQWTAEIEIDAARARELIGRRFPALAQARIDAIGNGWDNAAFLVDDTYVFRFPRRTIAVPLLEVETRVLPLIASHLPAAIPVPLFVGEPHGTYPWPFSGYRLLRGTTIDVRGPTDHERAALAPALGAFLRALHALDPAPALEGGLGPDRFGRMDHARRAPQARERFAQLRDVGLVRDAEPFLAEMERIAPTEEPVRLSIVHGHLYARHVVVDEHGALTGVIDWGDIHLGDPAIDLAIAHLVLRPAMYPAFLAEYGAIDERTWLRARYRAIYSAVLVADYGHTIGDRALRDAGLWALSAIQESFIGEPGTGVSC